MDMNKWPKDDPVIQAVIKDTRLAVKDREAFIVLYLIMLDAKKK
jgi:hypothetical protein